MISRDDDKKDSLNLIIYEYLLKSNFHQSASSFKEEAGIGEYKMSDSLPVLARWYLNFLETVDVRSGQRIQPDILNRIEGVMLKLENEKQRYARMRNPSERSQPVMRHPVDPRDYPSVQIHPTSLVLVEYKKIDLGISTILHSNFCPANNILITFSSDLHFYFYNLETNEIEYDFGISQRCLKLMKVKEVNSTIYMAYSSDDYSIRLCKYENAKKSDIKVLEFETPIKFFCISHDMVYVIEDTGTIKSFTFLGVCTGALQSVSALSIDCIGDKLIVIDQSRVAEYDRMGTEIAVLARSRFPIVKIKNENIFMILNDSVQVIDGKTGNAISSVKCTLPCKDIALLFNTIAVCTSTDLFYATDIIPLKNPIELDCYSCFNTKGLIIVSADGIVTLLTRVAS